MAASSTSPTSSSHSAPSPRWWPKSATRSLHKCRFPSIPPLEVPMLPTVNLRPPFNITRASHIVLHVADLKRSRDFYTNIVGLVVTEETATECYLRGLSEACHHSLVLVQTRGEATCKRIGFRVFF